MQNRFRDPSKQFKSQYDGSHKEQQVENPKINKQYGGFQPNGFIFGQSIISKLLGSWVTPIVEIGYRQPLNLMHIPQLQQNDKIKYKLERLSKIFEQQAQKPNQKPGRILLKALIKYQFKQQIVFLVITFFILLCKIFILLFNQQLVKYIEQGQRTTYQNIKYLSIYAGLSCFQTFSTIGLYYIYHVYDQDFAYLLSLMIYKKVLNYPLISSQEFQLAQIINYSQIDAFKFVWLHWEITIILYSTIYVIACLGLVFYFVGFICLFCFIFLAGIVSISFIFFNIIESIENLFNQAKDKTLKLLQQMLKSINFIKFNVLEQYFLNKIMQKRDEQLKTLSSMCLLKTAINFIFSLVSPIQTIIVFLLYLKYYDQQISTSLAFLVLNIFSNIQVLVQDFPQWFSHFISVWVSVKRIQKFLLSSSIRQLSIQQKCEEHQNSIQIKNGNFFTQQKLKQQQNSSLIQENIFAEQSQVQLRKVFNNLNVGFEKGKLTIIYGSVGSGKTSLIYCILNQMINNNKQNSDIIINGSLSYSSQKPWIFKGTIRENILFYSDYNEQRLKQAIYWACLQKDLTIFKKGIETQISEKGANLSGGQKARISLARAIYSDKDIMLLDDILSALDIHVYNFILQETIKKYLSKKTIIMTTNDINLLRHADNIYEIINWQVLKLDKHQILAKPPLKNQHQIVFQRKLSQYSNKQKQLLTQSLINPQKQQENIILLEEKEVGDIPQQLYNKLIDLNGSKVYIITTLILLMFWSFSTYFSNLQIQNWCQDQDRSNVYIYLYIGMVLVSGIVLSLACYLLQICQIAKNKNLLNKIVKTIINAGIIEFFNRVPSGRILNRLTNDLINIDLLNFHNIKPILINLFSIMSCLIAFIVVCGVGVVIPLIILLFIFIFYLNYFIKGEQECLRMEKIQNSNIVAGVVDSLDGLVVIRAFKNTQIMLLDQQHKIDLTRQISITRISLQYWFLIRHSLIAFIAILGIVIYCIFNKDKSGPQLGLILIYAINFTQQIGFLFPNLYGFREKMVQFQRLNNLCLIQPEKGYKQQIPKSQFQQNLPHKIQNAIQFIDFSCRYRQDLPFILKRISFKIPLRAKVGIVGRTGAGKTSIFNSLLRILQPASGFLYVNGHQIRQHMISNLRSQLAIIQQNPIIIEGTLRQNLDPKNIYSDSQISQVLRQSKLDVLLEEGDSLSQEISNANVSQGVKQIINICRTILKKSKIILMDQPTANIDSNLNSLIHQILDRSFRQRTVLSIAHKLSTLKNSQYVLVLEDGKVSQFDKTQQLLNKPNSLYRKMCESSDNLYLI